MQVGTVLHVDIGTHTVFNQATAFTLTGGFNLLFVGRAGIPKSHYKVLVKQSDRVFPKDHLEVQSKYSFF
jgi:hypothetical protein